MTRCPLWVSAIAHVCFGPKSDMCSAKGDVRFGSKADICSAKRHVRFTPESGHLQCTSRCPLSANSGHELALATLFEQSESATQRICCCFALVFRHTLDFELEFKVLRPSLLNILF